MTLDAPNLDSRRFDDLMAEARQRIARWAPEWTDHNASDPGITLVELFAWLTETILHELNRVPDLSYVKFLELLGLRPVPASAAVAELTFTATVGASGPVLVPAGSAVTADGADGVPVVFETDTELAVIPFPLTDLWVDDGASLESVLAASADPGAGFRPFGWTPEAGHALYLGFRPAPGRGDPATDAVAFPAELSFRVSLPPGRSTATVLRAERALTPPVPPVRLAWEFRPGPDLGWRPLQQFADSTVAFTREGYVQLAGPARIVATRELEQDQPRYWLRCRLAEGRYPDRDLVLAAITPNTVSARNLSTVTEELLGITEGHPNESFDTEHSPVVADSVRLEVRPEAGPEEDWTQVADFLAADPDATVYTVDEDAGRIGFGDGRHGRIPPVGAEVVVTNYRFGGGPAGNLPAEALNALQATVPGVASVTNRRPAVGGSVRETLAELKRAAPALLRRQDRAVTAADYASLARQVGGVADAVALPLAHPQYPDVEVPGAVTVVVVAEGSDEPPVPSPELLAAVARQLAPRRMITTELYVRKPDFVQIGVVATLDVQPHAAFGAVVRKATDALARFLAPVSVDDAGARSASFGRSLYPTELYRVLMADPDVVRVAVLELIVSGRQQTDLSVPVPLPPWGLRLSGEHAITVRPV